MNDHSNWYAFDHTRVDSPALMVYPDSIQENIRMLKQSITNVSLLRPHVKTNKTKEVTLMLMAAGIRKFKCSTIAEAEMLALCNAPDVLLAYQPTLRMSQRLVKLITHYSRTSFSCLVDNEQTASLLSTVAGENKMDIAVYIDLNVGMNRTGIKPGRKAEELFEYLNTLPHLSLCGFHAYDGHIREDDLEKRTTICNEAFAPVEKMREDLAAKGYPFPLLVAGGSPTCFIHAKRRQTECGPGTFVFWDKGYHDSLPEQTFLYAAVILTRVISIPDEGKICIDLGYKAIASENDLQHRVYFLNAQGLKPIIHSEEHMVLETGTEHGFKVGDVLYAVPYHICPTVAMYSHLVCVESGKATEHWPVIARDRKINV